jgi:hypothetical protein
MRQAGYTAEEWMRSGAEAIDKKFGEGTALKHPELLCAFMQAAAVDQFTMHFVNKMDALTEKLGNT